MNFHVVIKFLRKYDHIRKLNFQVAIKTKVRKIFRKFLLILVFLHLNSLLLQKKINKFQK